MSLWIYASVSTLSIFAAFFLFTCFYFKRKVSKLDKEKKIYENSVKLLEAQIFDEKSEILSLQNIEKRLQDELNAKKIEIKDLQEKEKFWREQEKNYLKLELDLGLKEEKISNLKEYKEKFEERFREIEELNKKQGHLQQQIAVQSNELISFRGKEKEWNKEHAAFLTLQADFSNLKNKLEDRDVLIDQFKSREEKWMKFAGGNTLEQLIEKKKVFDENRKKIKGETKNAGDVGAKLEEVVAEILESLFPKHLPYVVKWERQKVIDSEINLKDRVDFVLEFFNSKLNGSFKVLIECKSQIDDDVGEWMIIKDEKQEEEHLKKGKDQIVKGIRQLIKYSDYEKANFCLLITTSRFNKKNTGFIRFNWEEYRIEYKASYPEIFLVSLEVLSTILIIISSISGAYEPTISLSQSFDEWFKEDFVEYLSKVGETTRSAKTKMDTIWKRSDKAEKAIYLLNKEIKRVLLDFERREDALMNFLRALEMSPRKEILKLEDSQIVETELDCEEAEKKD